MKIRSILRSAFDHPFLLSTIFSLIIIYKYLPSLFTLLTASFPVIFFSAIFLGIILIYGEPNSPETRNTINPLNRTRVRLADQVQDPNELPKPESDKSDDDSDSYSTTEESEINPTLDEIHPLLDSGPASKEVSDSESDSDKEEPGNKEEAEKAERKVVAWTADDQKTLQQIGSLEIERNTRLENLIARRKAVRKIVERDLIDLDGFEATQFQIQPVIAPKRNPFDLPYEEEIPGSAPSVLLPISRNPFDFPFDQPDESENLNPTFYANANNNDVNNVNSNINSGLLNNNNNNDFRKNALFRRHESFTIGAPVQFLGEIRVSDSRANYRFKPFFMPEKMNFDKEGELEREISEKSKSLERETPLTHDDDVSSESDESSSEEGEKKEEEELRDDESNDFENYENYNSSSEEGNNENLEGENEKTMDLEGKNDEKSLENDDDSESNVEQLGKEEEPVVDCHVADPVYDSSPTAHEKPAILVEALFNDANTEADSDSKETTLPPKEKQASNEEAVWVAPSLVSVDEIESRSRGLSEIREHDIIGAQLSEIHDDLSRSITPIVRDLDH